jgi:hypothetical protein
MGEGRGATKHEGKPFLDSTVVPSVREMTTDAIMMMFKFASVTVLFQSQPRSDSNRTGRAASYLGHARDMYSLLYFKLLTPNTHTLTTMRSSMVVL